LGRLRLDLKKLRHMDLCKPNRLISKAGIGFPFAVQARKGPCLSNTHQISHNLQPIDLT
jgi:hypothetical protein